MDNLSEVDLSKVCITFQLTFKVYKKIYKVTKKTAFSLNCFKHWYIHVYFLTCYFFNNFIKSITVHFI